MDNMNKENFFDALYEAYPNAVKEFFDFIDEYKKFRKWNELFGNEIKFHHIPVEMQLGIWIAFLNEQGCGSAEIVLDSNCFDLENLHEWLSEDFRHREIEIKLEKKSTQQG